MCIWWILICHGAECHYGSKQEQILLSLFKTQQRVGVLNSKVTACITAVLHHIINLPGLSASPLCGSYLSFCYLLSLLFSFSSSRQKKTTGVRWKSEVFSLDPMKSVRHKTQLSLSNTCHDRCIGENSVYSLSVLSLTNLDQPRSVHV